MYSMALEIPVGGISASFESAGREMLSEAQDGENG
jgi:hypothetical protein